MFDALLKRAEVWKIILERDESTWFCTAYVGAQTVSKHAVSPHDAVLSCGLEVQRRLAAGNEV